MLLEKQSQCPWIRVSGPTELKSNSHLLISFYYQFVQLLMVSNIQVSYQHVLEFLLFFLLWLYYSPDKNQRMWIFVRADTIYDIIMFRGSFVITVLLYLTSFIFYAVQSGNSRKLDQLDEGFPQIQLQSQTFSKK